MLNEGGNIQKSPRQENLDVGMKINKDRIVRRFFYT